MSEFNFKSQICTTMSQSEALLKLGLKKETADMHWYKPVEFEHDYWFMGIGPEWCGVRDIPAWSLHRLIEMMPEEMYGGLLCIFKDSIRYEEVIMDRLEAHFEVVGENMYENAISCIEWLIKEGYFNKEYLV